MNERSIRRLAPIVTFAATCGLAAPSAAQVPAATYFSNLGSSENPCPGSAPYPFSCSVDVSNPHEQYVASTLTSGGLLPAADVAHEGSGDLNAGNTLGCSAAVRYFVVARRIGPPTPGVWIPLRIRAVGELTVTSGIEFLRSEGTLIALDEGVAAIAENGTETRSLQLDRNFDVQADVPFEIVIEARLRVLGASAPEGPWSFAGQAVVDPEVTIDPNFPEADQYYLEFSENLWAIFIDGFENGGTTHWSSASP